MQFRRSPMGGHLAAAGGRVGSGSDGGEQHLGCSDAERQAQRAIAVIGVDPILFRTKGQRRGHLHSFMTGAADLEKDAVLSFEGDLPIVEPPGEVHDAEGTDQGFRIQPSQTICGGCLTGSDGAHGFAPSNPSVVSEMRNIRSLWKVPVAGRLWGCWRSVRPPRRNPRSVRPSWRICRLLALAVVLSLTRESERARR